MRDDGLYSPEAEIAVLGGMFLSAEHRPVAVEVLGQDGEAFVREGNRFAYRSMLRLDEARVDVDPVTLAEDLKAHRMLDLVGGLQFIASLMDAVPSGVNVRHYAEVVRDLWERRRAMEAFRDAAGSFRDRSRPYPEILSQAQQDTFGLSGSTARKSQRMDGDAIFERFLRLQERMAGGSDALIKTGFWELDEMVQILAGDLVIVGGRPGMGKTSFLMQIIQHVFLKQLLPAALFSLEMSKESLLDRMLCNVARVDLSHFRKGTVSEDELTRLATNSAYINQQQQKSGLWVDDTPGLHIAEMRARARRIKAENPDLAVIGVDYLQLMEGKGETRNHEVSDISRGLKAMGKELDCAVVALSQLSRKVEERQDKRPMLSDLRDSGAVEQDADCIMFTYRPEYYFGPTDKQGNSIEGKAVCIVGKQRNGATGDIDLNWIKEHTRFESPVGA